MLNSCMLAILCGYLINSEVVVHADFTSFNRLDYYRDVADRRLSGCKDETCRINGAENPITRSISILPVKTSNLVKRYVRGELNKTNTEQFIDNLYLDYLRSRFGSVIDDLNLVLKFAFNIRISEMFRNLMSVEPIDVAIDEILKDLRRSLNVPDAQAHEYWDAVNTLVSYGSDLVRKVLEKQNGFGEKCGSIASPNPYHRPASLVSMMRVVGGLPIQKGEYKFLVTLRYNGRAVCAGTILDSTHILTAAHCTRRLDRTQLSVGVAEHRFYVDEGQQLVSVSKINNYPYYDGVFSKFIHYRLRHDLSVLTLTRPVHDVANTEPVCMPKGRECRNLKGRRCMVVGWGANSVVNDKLQFPNLPHDGVVYVYDGAACPYKPKPKYTRVQLCATGPSDTCNGDSGGPLLCDYSGRWVQCGITSYGPKQCNQPRTNGVYTNVAQYQAWINRLTRTVRLGNKL